MQAAMATTSSRRTQEHRSSECAEVPDSTKTATGKSRRDQNCKNSRDTTHSQSDSDDDYIEHDDGNGKPAAQDLNTSNTTPPILEDAEPLCVDTVDSNGVHIEAVIPTRPQTLKGWLSRFFDLASDSADSRMQWSDDGNKVIITLSLTACAKLFQYSRCNHFRDKIENLGVTLEKDPAEKQYSLSHDNLKRDQRELIDNMSEEVILTRPETLTDWLLRFHDLASDSADSRMQWSDDGKKVIITITLSKCVRELFQYSRCNHFKRRMESSGVKLESGPAEKQYSLSHDNLKRGQRELIHNMSKEVILTRPETITDWLSRFYDLADSADSRMQWSDDGNKVIITLSLTECARELFQYSRASHFSSRMKSLGVKLESGPAKKQYSLSHDNLKRGQRELIDNMMLSHQPHTRYTCVCKCCPSLGRAGDGCNRVRDDGQMCQDCLVYWNSPHRSDEDHNKLLPFHIAHLEVAERRRKQREPYNQRISDRRSAMKQAKADRDLPKLVQLFNKTSPVERCLREFGRNHVQLIANKKEVAKHVAAVVMAATDGHLAPNGCALLKMKAASANAVRFAAQEMYELKKARCKRTPPQPKFQVKLHFSLGGAGFAGGKSKTYPLGKKFSLDDDVKFEWAIKVGNELNGCRKYLQKLHGTGLMQRLRNGDAPNVTLEQLRKCIVEIEDDTLRNYILPFLDNGVNDHVVQCLLGGTFYAHIRTSVTAWWCAIFVNTGLGGSHYTMPFNKTAFMEIVELAPISEEEFFLRLILWWANCDGSIRLKYFELIVPDDKRDDSVKSMILEIFEKYLDNIKPTPYSKKGKRKDIVYLRVSKKADLKKLAEKLEPYIDEGLTHDRKESLLGYEFLGAEDDDDDDDVYACTDDEDDEDDDDDDDDDSYYDVDEEDNEKENVIQTSNKGMSGKKRSYQVVVDDASLVSEAEQMLAGDADYFLQLLQSAEEARQMALLHFDGEVYEA